MTVDSSPGLEGPTFVAPKPKVPTGPAATSPTTSRAVNGAADAVEAIGKGELAAIQTVDEVARGEMSMPQIAPDNPEPRPVVVPVPTSEGVDSASPPSNNGAEVPPAAAETSAEVIDPKVDRVGRQRARALIKIKGTQNRVDIYPTLESQNQARAAVDSNTEDIKATLGALKVIKGYASDVPTELAEVSEMYDDISQNVFVTAGGKTYLLSDLEAERAGANEARQKQIDEIITGGTYELSFDEEKFQEASVSKQKETLDQTADRNISDLRGVIDERKANKQPTEAYEAILKGLEIAQGFEGNTRAFFQLAALRRLRGSGLSLDPAGLNQAINGSSEVYNKAQEALIVNALDQGYTPEQAKFIVDTLNRGDFAELKRVGFFSKPGVDRLLFGRQLSNEEMNKLLDLISGDEKRKFGKDQALMVLLMALVGVTQATRQAVMGELRK